MNYKELHMLFLHIFIFYLLFILSVLLFRKNSLWCFFFFFFSSRRRHTRLQGDWSSDVCSSDLKPTLRAMCDCLPPARSATSPRGAARYRPIHRHVKPYYASPRRAQGRGRVRLQIGRASCRERV